MPHQDTRRLHGPQVTQSLVQVKAKEALLNGKTGKRVDGRLPDEIRPMYCKTGAVHQANGSSYIETEGTKLICAVYGPRDHQKRHEYNAQGTLTCEVNFAPFSRHDRRIDSQDSHDKNFSSAVLEALKSAVCLSAYPKAQIDVFITILEDDRNSLSHAIVAAALALTDAGIEMLDLVTSASLSFSKDENNSRVFIDPLGSEVLQCEGSLTVAYLPSLNQISYINKQGKENLDDVIQNINTCIEACLRVHSAMKECLVSATVDDDEET